MGNRAESVPSASSDLYDAVLKLIIIFAKASSKSSLLSESVVEVSVLLTPETPDWEDWAADTKLKSESFCTRFV